MFYLIEFVLRTESVNLNLISHAICILAPVSLFHHVIVTHQEVKMSLKKWCNSVASRRCHCLSGWICELLSSEALAWVGTFVLI